MIILANNQINSRRFIQEICRINGNSVPSTIGVEFYVSNMALHPRYEDSARITFQIWRILNTPRIALLRSNLYLGARGAILILDLNSTAYFDHLEAQIHELRAQMADISIIMVGYNSENNLERQITTTELLEFASFHNVTYVENNIVKVTEIFQLLGYQMTRLSIPNDLENLVQLSYHSTLADLVTQIRHGEVLNARQSEFFQNFAGFKERILLERRLPADHMILELFNNKYQIMNQMGFNLLL